MTARAAAAGRPSISLAARAVITAVTCCWLTALVVPPVLLLRTRDEWMRQLDRPEQQGHWDAFRRDMALQTGRDGPVQRKVPRSTEPPARVWLRDHAALAVTAWLLFVGVLGGFVCLLVAGVLRGGGRPSLAQDESRGHRDQHEQNQRDAQNTKQ